MRTKRLAIMFAVLGLLAALTTTAYATSSAKAFHAIPRGHLEDDDPHHGDQPGVD